MRDQFPLFGGIDGGGTKWICAVGTSPSDVRSSIEIPTSTNPHETLDKVATFFSDWLEEGKLSSIGLSCFGPLERDISHPDWGKLHKTPNVGWEMFDLGKELKRRFPNTPIGIETDVAGSALAEAKWGGGFGLKNLCYLTVGTGIGGAIIANGKLVSGVAHSEIGHTFAQPHPDDDYPGCCIAHGKCFEGLASGRAVLASTGEHAVNLPDDHKAWDFVGYYLGQLCANIFMFSSPRRIILGGGLMKRSFLIHKIRASASNHLGGYTLWPGERDMDEAIIVSPWVKNQRQDKANSGVFGGFLVAENALKY
ncbi:ROK family protein [Leisingera sp. S232]|uniref:ROK family protein n=1 Tax=Leisingera sp. S232 TaxID=3415132 RepID=UPI003C7E37B8